MIFKKLAEFYQNKKPFVVYRKPNEIAISGFFMQSDEIITTLSFSESGFVFAPFDTEKEAILFPENSTDFMSENLKFENSSNEEKQFLEANLSNEKHLKIVEKAIDNIRKSKFKKVVISRKEELEISDFDLVKIYQQLLQKYANAFVYVWFHPKVGLWLGATPETLLEINGNSFKTMSLAGTQEFKNEREIIWGNKELEEQKLVTSFIENQLIGISSNLKIDKTETVKAGNLWHLKTKVTGEIVKNATLKKLIRALHPTPAVCGLPREKAKKFILENENYNRSFYTGFLGELNIKNNESDVIKSSLYVNLRCMEIQDKKAFIYVGGGITKDSNPKNEWLETVAKSKTMKRVL